MLSFNVSQCFVLSSKLINQTKVQGISSKISPAICKLPDICIWKLPVAGNLCDEVIVHLVKLVNDYSSFLLSKLSVRHSCIFVLAGNKPFVSYIISLQQT